MTRKDTLNSGLPLSKKDKTTRGFGDAGEAKALKCMSGRKAKTPGSGSGRVKGDFLHGERRDGQARNYRRCVEVKTTAKQQYTLKVETLEKLEYQAFNAGQEPVFVVNFENKVSGCKEWGMVPLDVLNELFEGVDRMK